MSRRTRQTRRTTARRQTNWVLIGLIVGGGILLLVGLFFLAFQEPAVSSLADYCDQNPANCLVTGQANAPVTIVEVSDYGCGHCRNFNRDTAELLYDQYVATGQARWVILPFALRAQTATAAAAAFCAADQNRFNEFHHAVFDLQDDPAGFTRDNLLRVAGQVGLDTNAFAGCYDAGTHTRKVDNNIREANLMGVKATPTFFINGNKLEGNFPLPAFQQRIDNALSLSGG